MNKGRKKLPDLTNDISDQLGYSMPRWMFTALVIFSVVALVYTIGRILIYG